MSNILPERNYQHYVMDYLEEHNGYHIRDAKTDFDRLYAMDRTLLMKFLNSTQPDEMARLERIYKEDLGETIVSQLNAKVTQKRGSLLHVLKHGLELSGVTLRFMYTKPATGFNKSLNEKYEHNILSVMKEVWASDSERVDLVIFLNGLAIMSFELKSETSGQTYEDAIKQYREKRNPKDRLFLFKAGCLVNFAMDADQVHMTTKLDRRKTYFLPFNRGNGHGITKGAGNPPCEDDYPVSYMWRDILTRDTIIDLISRFMFITKREKVDEVTGEIKEQEVLIFPRYHQLDCIRKLVASVSETGTSRNYLIQHSAGSGKTNTIAWLAHRLTSLHDVDDRVVFDNVVIVTDRVVVDRQLQKAVLGLEHASGLIRVMDDSCTSADLARALKGNTKIIATTIQKFPFVVEQVSGLAHKRFAVIIDEAHSSTAGKSMEAVRQSLGSVEVPEGESDIQDFMAEILASKRKGGKRENVAMFAFTATPKPTTLMMFGTPNAHGQRVPFHVYSMKQAIEEGFILDVLANYTTYQTYYQINKDIEEDPEYQTKEARRQIARFAELHDTNIAQRVQIIVEHFRTTVMQELGGHGKAMVVTGSREEAVRYTHAFREYCERKGYDRIHALVAFSGKVKLKEDETEYTEAGMNGFGEKDLPERFGTDDYQVLLVANKYQTGFDEPKLCAMYVLKNLSGVAAVQTLSRLNRICPPYEKHTFVLDFKNSYEDMKEAFAPFFSTTILSNSITPQAIYDIDAQIDAYDILDPEDVDRVYEIMTMGRKPDTKEVKKVKHCLNKAKHLFDRLSATDQQELYVHMRGFLRFYGFMMQVSCFWDPELDKKAVFLDALMPTIKPGRTGEGFDLSDKIRASNFAQEEKDHHEGSDLVAKPIVTLSEAEMLGLTEEKKERLSEIIAQINSRTGKEYNNDVAVKAMLQIKDLLMKSEKLRISARNNTEKDFEYAYFDDIDDVLIEGLSQNQDFFSLLLSNEEIKREVLGIFADEIYRSLRNNDQ
ncbi:type I restriction endonuclease subunit R [Bifidobacterium pseudolongum]|uniref:type I restriction endonuclease subunit R n=1 Tax=Bifidobacterium pseudolongum TaxID=1694 RepID=UPI0010EBB123|nr:DEAD/DEAH box helicase family protein [Bifidobacterium pseudolongum]RYQ09025.1 type I restriction endonuclease [Bifidobacterium pseudolongum subsp. globosum]